MDERLSEQDVQDGFHAFLTNALAQAKVERLLDPETLASAEADLMICGPALCLYFAALRSVTSPPSVPMPRREKMRGAPPLVLAAHTCPAQFAPYFAIWAKTVPDIQSLVPEHQHDLARIICNHPPISSPPNSALPRIAADLRAVAIEISQRRTFQDRYADDLQAALNAGEASTVNGRPGTPNNPRKATFVPPPMYDDGTGGDTTLLSPVSATFPRPNGLPRTSSNSSSRSTSPSFLTTSPTIVAIRETLYAALADVLTSTPSLRPLLASDPPRAYFNAVALAILDVALQSVVHVPDEGSFVRGVLGKDIVLADCPAELKPFFRELVSISHRAAEIGEEDDQRLIRKLERGSTNIPEPRMERLRRMLERGVGYAAMEEAERTGRSASPEGTVMQLANRVNALALGMSKLAAFRERQDVVFKVLAGAAQ
ncbi:hypothetical protein BOTBODRAFT_118235 [Botryobasidium botryosum FD-172 SS1]|uniref:Uncharacterized protein n=1 Tax=Botryobasidium botryosum (strain FD-172 SS1) TaxID=930990 RepID=A0A067MAU3_BOTB1|nr:hypothetical protein BOTBODRAFT_118235 [Botryobasidium botryosum FD-172 SS1]